MKMRIKIRSVSLAGLHVIDGPKLYAQHPEPFLSDALFKRFSSLLVPKTELCGRACWFYESFSSQLFLFDSEELSGDSYDRNVFRFTIVFAFEVEGDLGPCISRDLIATQLSAYTVALLSLCEDFRQVEQRHAYLSTSFKHLPSVTAQQQQQLSPPFPSSATETPLMHGGGVSPMPMSSSLAELLPPTPSSPVSSTNAFLPSRGSLSWNSLSDVMRMVFQGLHDDGSASPSTSGSSMAATEVHLNSCYSIHISLIQQRVNSGVTVRPHYVPVVIAEDSSGGGREAWSDITLADLYSAIDGTRTVDDISRLMGVSSSAPSSSQQTSQPPAGPADSRSSVCLPVNRTVAEGLQQLVLNDYVRLLEPVTLQSIYNATPKLKMTIDQGDVGKQCRVAISNFMCLHCGPSDESSAVVSAVLLALHSFVHRSVEAVQAKMRRIPQFAGLLENWHTDRLAKVVELGLLNEWLTIAE